MTVTVALALLLQAAGIMLLRVGLGRCWLRRPVTLLYLAAVASQGLPAVLLAFPSVRQWDTFRSGITPGYAGEAALLTSAAMLALAVGYLLTRPQRVIPAAGTQHRTAAITALDWRLLALSCVPLAVLTYEGKGYNNGTGIIVGASLGTDLAATFFTILVIITAFSVLLRTGPRWFLPILIGQSASLAAAGERTPVLTGAVALAIMATRAGLRPSRAQGCAAAALTLLAIVAVTGARANQGRTLFYSNSGLGARSAALGAAALGGTSSQPDSPGLAAQLASRLDADAFTGGILQSEALGQPRLSAAYVPESLLVTVPSALWPSKLARGYALDPAILETDDFGLQQINFLPGLPGLYAGFLSPPWLGLVMACLGAHFGRAERWLLRECTPARLVLLAGAVTAALGYQGGLPAMLLDLRAAAVIAAAVRAIEAVRVRRRGLAPDLEPLPLS